MHRIQSQASHVHFTTRFDWFFLFNALYSWRFVKIETQVTQLQASVWSTFRGTRQLIWKRIWKKWRRMRQGGKKNIYIYEAKFLAVDEAYKAIFHLFRVFWREPLMALESFQTWSSFLRPLYPTAGINTRSNDTLFRRSQSNGYVLCFHTVLSR